MGLYERYVGPRLVNLACSLKSISEERRKVVPRAEGVVVEVGIGSGLNLPFYKSERVSQVIGLDPNASMLALGRARIAGAGVPLRIIECSAESIPLESEAADCVVLTYTLCSVRDPGLTLGEIRRILKPGGRILFLEHGRSNEPRVARWQDRLNPLWRRIGCGCNLNRDTLRLLSEAELDLREVEQFYLPGDPKIIGFHSRGIACPR